MDLATHPLYHDEQLLAAETAKHVRAGRTVFQVWQAAGNERDHSLVVLEALDLPLRARVLSLGCGVGGMERYWQAARPDLRFTLANQSESQLQACLCPGRRVRMDAEDQGLPAGGDYHCVLVAYLLGHVSPERVLLNAVRACKRGGLVVVLDVFDASDDFAEGMSYLAPTCDLMRLGGFEEVGQCWSLADFGEEALPGWIHEADPRMWVRHV
jgi:SAM-dependent methyltransferase